MLWVLFALMAACVGIATLWPLGKDSDAPVGRRGKAMAIYEDQLAEVDRDTERGLITPEEGRAAQVEIKRRMLATSEREEVAQAASGRVALFAAALLTPLAGFALYTQVGAPDIPSMPFAERGAEQDDARQLQALVTELRSRLENDPQGGETRGWELLAGTYMNTGRPDLAAEAFAQIVERDDATSATWSQYAEALISAESGAVTPLAKRAIARAAELDPTNPAATFYGAVAMEQEGNTADARASLLERINQETQFAPWMPTFLATANQMGERLGLDPVAPPEFAQAPGPSAADVEAAAEMSEEEQMAFITSMVDGLEARLQDTPEDLEGWLQLTRALTVLGEEERALAALQNAEPLVADLPEDDPRRVLVETGLAQLGGN